MRKKMGNRMYVVRRSDGDIAFRSLCHCCIHRHIAGDKPRVRRGRAGQADLDKQQKKDTGFATVARGQRGTPGGPTGFENVVTRSRRKTQGSPARPKDEEDKRTRRGGQEEDKNRTKGGRRVGQRSQTTRTGQKERRTGGRQEEEDKSRTRGGQKKRRTREGQEEEKRRTKGSQRTTTGLEKDRRGGQED